MGGGGGGEGVSSIMCHYDNKCANPSTAVMSSV